MLTAVTGLADHSVWAVDIIGAPSALLSVLLSALLAQAGQEVFYASGRVVSAMSSAFTREGKTDAKDAHAIAQTVRLRRDLSPVDPGTDLVRMLGLLTAHRADLIADRVRMINRLRDVMTSLFPSLEREFDYSSCKGALVLLGGYATPARLRRLGANRLSTWLRARHVRNYADVAARAVTAAQAQLEAGIAFMNARGLLHFDAHFDNVLTDGQRLYFTDYGLAISSRFELSPEEASFFDRHQAYDRCYTATYFVNWLVTALYGFQVDDRDGRYVAVRAYAEGRQPVGVPDEAAKIIARHAPIAAVISDFNRKFERQSRRTPYPLEEVRQLDGLDR